MPSFPYVFCLYDEVSPQNLGVSCCPRPHGGQESSSGSLFLSMPAMRSDVFPRPCRSFSVSSLGPASLKGMGTSPSKFLCASTKLFTTIKARKAARSVGYGPCHRTYISSLTSPPPLPLPSPSHLDPFHLISDWSPSSWLIPSLRL